MPKFEEGSEHLPASNSQESGGEMVMGDLAEMRKKMGLPEKGKQAKAYEAQKKAGKERNKKLMEERGKIKAMPPSKPPAESDFEKEGNVQVAQEGISIEDARKATGRDKPPKKKSFWKRLFGKGK
jgi:hypothetical protein